MRLTQQLGVAYVPVADALRQARAENGPLSLPLYVPGDYTHLSAGGHGVVAGGNCKISYANPKRSGVLPVAVISLKRCL